MIFLVNHYPDFPESIRRELRAFDSTIIHLSISDHDAIMDDPGEYDRLMSEGLHRVLERLKGIPERFPAAMYELERDKHEGAIVLRRGVFERYDNRVAWYVTRDSRMEGLTVYPKESGRKDGLFFMHILSREDDITPYLWDTPEEAFEWWESNRERIVAFTSDRLRLRGEVEKAEAENGAN